MNTKISEILEAVKGRRIGLDTETTGLNVRKDTLIGISIAVEDGGDYYIPLNSSEFPYLETLEQLKPIGYLPQLVCIHNAKFDLSIFHAHGIHFTCPVADSYVGSLMVDESRYEHSLNALSRDFLGDTKLGSYKTIGGLFGPSMSEYAKKDARLHLRLYLEYIYPNLEKLKLTKIFWDLEMPILKILVETEYNGIKINVNHLRNYKKIVTAKLDKIIAEAYDMVGEFNIGSNDQVAELLFDKLKIPTTDILKTDSGKLSTKESELEKIRDCHPIVNKILEYRGQILFINRYINPILYEHLDHESRIHPTFYQVGAKARMSSDNPNAQNIPSGETAADGIRKAFEVDSDCFMIQADFSQIELRVAAHICNEPVMIDAFSKGEDLHKKSAKLWNVPRQQAKTANFGLIFGMSAKKFSMTNDISLEDSILLRENFFKTYTTFKNYYNNVHSTLRKTETLNTIIGRKRIFKGYIDKSWVCSRFFDPKTEQYIGCDNYFNASITFKNGPSCNRQLRVNWNGSAINFPIQGTAADIMKISLRNIHRKIVEYRKTNPIWNKVYIISIIHDEFLVNTPKSITKEVYDLVKYEMENCVKLKVPIIAEALIVRNWGESKLKYFKRIRRYLREKVSRDDIMSMFCYKDNKFKDKLFKLINKYE